MTINILEVTNDDIDKLLVIENELYAKPWTKKDYEYELNENPFAIYLKMIDKDSGNWLGFVGFWIKFEQGDFTKVSIAKKYQGLKLSKILMSDALRRMKLAGCTSVTLDVRVSNEKAIGLYTSFGFKTLTTRRRYYENGEDAYLMYKELSDDNTSN